MKQTAVDFLIYHIRQDTFVHSKSTKEWNEVFQQSKAMEKEQACDFADYVINRAKEFEDGMIDHREYESSIDEMFERRYRDGGAELSTEEKQYWEDVDKLRKEREEKYK
jgi:hypothetical protein